MSGTVPFSSPWFLDSWILTMDEAVPYFGHWFKAYTAIWRTLPQPAMLLSSNWCYNCVFKMPFLLSIRSVSSRWGKHDKTSGSTVSLLKCPLSHLSSCEVSSLVRGHTVWNPMSEDKTFCKAMDCGFGRSIMCKKGKSITRISIYTSKEKAFPF